MKVGYIRVSTIEQNEARQEILMEQLGVERVYMDKMSGKSKDRPQLQEMMQYVREGDIVIVESISRFARNTKDLLSLIEELERKKVTFVSQKENIDTNTPAGRFMLFLAENGCTEPSECTAHLMIRFHDIIESVDCSEDKKSKIQ